MGLDRGLSTMLEILCCRVCFTVFSESSSRDRFPSPWLIRPGDLCAGACELRWATVAWRQGNVNIKTDDFFAYA